MEKKFQIMDDDTVIVRHIEDFVELDILENSTGKRMLIQIDQSQVAEIVSALVNRQELAYGKWCTIDGNPDNRYMITDWDSNSVTIFDSGRNFSFGMSRVSEVSDFMNTDAERKAKGYAF